MMADEIIDQATFSGLLDSLGGDVEFLRELVDAYVASSPDLLSSMRQAIAGAEAPALQRAAHSLKTGSACFGALAFAIQCRELEELGKAGALAEAEAKHGALEAAYAGVVAALEAHLQGACSAPARTGT
jgi:two-component system, sensor histidine kinase and response regulator